MLRVVRLVDQWREIQSGLPEDWGRAHLRLTLEDAADGTRAAGVLAPVNPAQRGKVLNFYAGGGESAASAELVMRFLQRLDSEGIRGRLELVHADKLERRVVEVRHTTLVQQWDELVAGLPPDWSDLYAEVELVSSDWLDRAALLMAPINPARYGDAPGFRFRVARQFGYGASAEMTRRCLERVDEEHIRGELRILRVLSDTDPVHTQGPVWYLEGRSV
jgi:hypothetical protein